MNREELSAKIREAFGGQSGSIKAAALALPINYDNLRGMLSGKRPVPDWLEPRLSALLALKEIKSPPSGLGAELDRDDYCGDALDPHIDHLAHRANEAGWTDPEVTAAFLGWVVHRTIETAGDEATKNLLCDALELVDLIKASQT